MLAALTQPDLTEHVVGTRPASAAVQAGRGEGSLDVLGRREGRDEVELLEDEADVVPAQVGQLLVAHPLEGVASEAHGALGGPVQRAQQLQQGALARATRSLHGDKLTRCDLEVDTVDGTHLRGTAVEPAGDGGELIHGVHGQPMSVRARAGRSRARRQPPTAPAMTPPRMAKATPSSRFPAFTGT